MPNPPPFLEIGREVPAIGAEDPGKKGFLPREGVKFFFTPCVYTQNTRNFMENSMMEENDGKKV